MLNLNKNGQKEKILFKVTRVAPNDLKVNINFFKIKAFCLYNWSLQLSLNLNPAKRITFIEKKGLLITEKLGLFLMKHIKDSVVNCFDAPFWSAIEMH